MTHGRLTAALLSAVALMTPLLPVGSARAVTSGAVTVSWGAAEHFGLLDENHVGAGHYYYAVNHNSVPVVVASVSLGADFVALPGSNCFVGANIPAGAECRLIVAAHPHYPGTMSVTDTLAMTFSDGSASTTSATVYSDSGYSLLDLGSQPANSVVKTVLNTTSESRGPSTAAFAGNVAGLSVDTEHSTCWSGVLPPSTPCTVSLVFAAGAAGGVSGWFQIQFIDVNTHDTWVGADMRFNVTVIPVGELPTVTIDDTNPALYAPSFVQSTKLAVETWQWRTARSSKTADDLASYDCYSCTAVGIWATMGPDRGIFVAYVDGQKVAVVDDYAPTLTRSTLVVGLPIAGPPRDHKVIILVTGQRRAASTGNWVEIDAITRVGTS